MRDDAGAIQPYEPPSIEERTPIDVPLIGVGGSPGAGPSAAFRSVAPEPYVAPRIEARDPLDVPLVGHAGSPIDGSAAFRSE
ncbi:MAG: hypothetical protein WD271_08815 [Acidimicrobiia bacterium]